MSPEQSAVFSWLSYKTAHKKFKLPNTVGAESAKNRLYAPTGAILRETLGRGLDLILDCLVNTLDAADSLREDLFRVLIGTHFDNNISFR